MAKYERKFKGNFDAVLKVCEDAILNGSMSASYEDGSDFEVDGVRLAVRVYERYSMFGGNRVSLSVALMGNGEEVFLTAISSGGSQAVLFKVNTLGEESFLETLSSVIDDYIRR